LHGIEVKKLDWPGESDRDVMSAIKSGLVDLVINVPKNIQRQELSYGSQIRQAAARFGCSLITNMELAVAFATALARLPNFVKTHDVVALPNYKTF
jgi:carbamoyl-phosphate synthase large subunit